MEGYQTPNQKKKSVLNDYGREGRGTGFTTVGIFLPSEASDVKFPESPPESQGLDMKDQDAIGDVIIEFHQVGHAIKVSAVDTKSYLEVSIVAPLDAGEAQMTETVLRKLAYVSKRTNVSNPTKTAKGLRPDQDERARSRPGSGLRC